MSDTCGHPTANGGECQNPATEGDHCWIPAHGGSADDHGRPQLFDDERRRELVFTAVRAGLDIQDQAAHAKVSEDTLRRRLCCVETPRKPTITTDEPCDFCESYAHAHGDGALRVLEQTSPEFRASASFGYTKTEKREVDADVSGDVVVDFDSADT